jgi:hypothetical protein
MAETVEPVVPRVLVFILVLLSGLVGLGERMRPMPADVKHPFGVKSQPRGGGVARA